jgi:hypothetical protein
MMEYIAPGLAVKRTSGSANVCRGNAWRVSGKAVELAGKEGRVKETVAAIQTWAGESRLPL